MSRRRLAAGLGLSLLLAAPLACGGDPRAPTAVAQRFVLAAQRGDTADLLPLLERSAAQRLQTAAERATHHVGGRRTIAPREMLQIVDVDPTLRITGVEADDEVVAQEGALTRARVLGGRGESIDLSLIFEDGAWRVQVPAPEPAAP